MTSLTVLRAKAQMVLSNTPYQGLAQTSSQVQLQFKCDAEATPNLGASRVDFQPARLHQLSGMPF
jgi:hypothetical protein